MGKRWKGFEDWDDEKVREHNERVRGARSTSGDGAGGVANNESNAINEPAKPNAPQMVQSQVDVRITHYRRRLCDPDGPVAKYWIDAIVEAGFLSDDSLTQIKEVRHRQVKIETWEEERTVIELIEARKGLAA